MKKQLLLKQVNRNNVFSLRILNSRPAFAGLLFAFLALLLQPGGCAQTSQVKANLGQQFSLAINQTALISGEKLGIKFLEVLDSRCPTGVQCIWAGEARADILISDGGTANLTLVVPGSSANNTQSYKGYNISFAVQPYPQANNPIAKADYRLVLKVEKGEEAPVE